MTLMRHIRPEARQRNVRIIVIVDALLHAPFLTDELAADILQIDQLSARSAFEAATQTTIGAEPLLRRYKDVWLLGPAAFRQALRAQDFCGSYPS